MKVKGTNYPIEWVNEDKALQVLDVIFNDKVTAGQQYRPKPEEMDIIAETMRFCIPSLPPECFFQERNGLTSIRLGATEILEFTFELLEVATNKKVIDLENFLAQPDLTSEEKSRANRALNNARENANSLRRQIREMQLAYLESLPNPQIQDDPVEIMPTLGVEQQKRRQQQQLARANRQQLRSENKPNI